MFFSISEASQKLVRFCAKIQDFRSIFGKSTSGLTISGGSWLLFMIPTTVLGQKTEIPRFSYFWHQNPSRKSVITVDFDTCTPPPQMSKIPDLEVDFRKIEVRSDHIWRLLETFYDSYYFSRVKNWGSQIFVDLAHKLLILQHDRCFLTPWGGRDVRFAWFCLILTSCGSKNHRNLVGWRQKFGNLIFLA